MHLFRNWAENGPVSFTLGRAQTVVAKRVLSECFRPGKLTRSLDPLPQAGLVVKPSSLQASEVSA